MVSWYGNFVTMTSDGKNQIDGTFLLSRNIFLEKFIFAQLQYLNQDTMIYHYLPKGTPENNGTISGSCEIDAGFHPDHKTRGDSFFDFSCTNPGNNPNLPVSYVWEKSIKSPPDTDAVYVYNKDPNLPSFKSFMLGKS